LGSLEREMPQSVQRSRGSATATLGAQMGAAMTWVKGGVLKISYSKIAVRYSDEVIERLNESGVSAIYGRNAALVLGLRY
jgi:DNA-binding transcriptional regulator of glucitol operon